MVVEGGRGPYSPNDATASPWRFERLALAFGVFCLSTSIDYSVRARAPYLRRSRNRKNRRSRKKRSRSKCFCRSVVITSGAHPATPHDAPLVGWLAAHGG